jgi:peroxiredoxin
MNDYQHFNPSQAPEVQAANKSNSTKTIIIAICLTCFACCLFVVCFGAILLLAKNKPIKPNVEATKKIEYTATLQPTESTLPTTEYTGTPAPTTTPVPTATIVATDMPPEKPQIGYTAPDFLLESMNGEQVQLSSLRGNPVVLNFWTSWCGYCADEMPDFQEAYDTYKDDGLIILAINVTVDDTRNDAIDYVNESGYSMPVLFDDNGDAIRKYNVNGYPNSFFIDTLGIIQDVAYGYIDAYTLESMLQSILN